MKSKTNYSRVHARQDALVYRTRLNRNIALNYKRFLLRVKLLIVIYGHSLFLTKIYYDISRETKESDTPVFVILKHVSGGSLALEPE